MLEKCRLRRKYSVSIGSPSPFPSPPRRGEVRWPRWDESRIGERPAVLEGVSLSSGERAGVRASVLSTELFRVSSPLKNSCTCSSRGNEAHFNSGNNLCSEFPTSVRGSRDGHEFFVIFTR